MIVLSSKKAFESTPEESTALSDLAVVMRVTDKEMTVSFDGLSAGEYTIKVLHDVDENGKMTFNGLLPKEPYGFSNNARNVFSEPDYEDCTFQLVAGKDKEMSIEVK